MRPWMVVLFVLLAGCQQTPCADEAEAMRLMPSHLGIIPSAEMLDAFTARCPNAAP